MLKKSLFWICGGMLLFLMYWVVSCRSQQPVDYSTQVKPIINKNCIACHGGVKKQGGFSLLFEEEAKAKLKSGAYGIVSGDARASEMIRRLSLQDPEERMPFEHNALPDEEIELLTRWVNEGANWGVHWAYKALDKVAVPKVKSEWPKNEIDAFVFSKAEEHKLTVSEKADPSVLARRLQLDIIGFPQNTETKTNFTKDPSDENYELLVDELLYSPHYGEKWTSMWLDLARYADTKGYERDGNRDIWRYRDWLIEAFNEDMPYNQFLTEQIAGDLLPEATDDQLIATAFHRNTMTNDEGGTSNEEYRVAAVVDRVNTTWEATMGTTFACIQCHSHPYDPFTHEEYYKFMGFFNNTRDVDTYEDYPLLRHFDTSQKEGLNQLANRLNKETGENKAAKIIHFIKTLQPSIASLESDDFVNAELSDTKWLAMRNNSSARIPKAPLRGKSNLVFSYSSNQPGGIVKILKGSLVGPEISRFKISRATKGWEFREVAIHPSDTTDAIYLTYQNPNIKDNRTNGVKFNWFHFDTPYPDSESKKEYWNLLTTETSSTPIMVENTAEMSRTTHVFERGSWLNKGEQVETGVPASLNKFPENYPKNRLGLAKWMTSKQNPLTARAIVNRLWEQIWGVGIVETLEDLGSQGEKPSNQELLDYLSWKLMNDYNWQLKPLLREIFLSSTYRQSSKLDPDKLEKDPTNRFVARGPRIRLSAEQIRDQALAASGKLNPEMFGKPVMPFQPEGIWNSPYNGDKWVKSENGQQYRRAIYTFWKRTSAYPSMMNFDAAGREVCSSRRITTNTPLQALTTLNDVVYIDLSNQMAKRFTEYSPAESISEAYLSLTGNTIEKNKQEILMRLYDKALKENQDSKTALALVMNALLNLDEVLMKS
jgi:mono/diheme cytochrome c family protein